MALLRDMLRRLDDATRPASDEAVSALRRRWDELPEQVKTPAQLLGRRGTGCEGTHGVFPQCNFGCRPCYHSSDANRVRVDGPHTITNVDAQMSFARRVRGPGAYAQLIGGEVTLLAPDDHAAALAAMRRHGREPMSFSHGDFDDDYLEALALDARGKPRFENLAFAIHVDSTMQGRRAVPRPSSEADLDGERERIAAMFARLRRRHGITSYLAHNMTVTPDNLDQVPGVISRNRHLGYRMFSFQPAAYVGHENRWKPGYRSFGDDDVWARIEEGAGVRLPFRGIQFGDLRCNRVTWGAFVGERYVPVLDDADQRDLDARDAFFAAFPGPLGHGPITGRVARVGRVFITHPQVMPAVAGWAVRFVERGGGLRAPWQRLHPTTFVMHRFIDAADAAEAWAALERGSTPTGELGGVAERLQACAYSMAHPETGRMVPACVQHSVLDPLENAQLVELLPRRSRGGPLVERRPEDPKWVAYLERREQNGAPTLDEVTVPPCHEERAMATAEYRLNLPARQLDDADPAVAAILAKAKGQMGMIPNMYANMANVPALLETYLTGYNAFRSESGFSAAEQETVLLAISRANGCSYCVAAHSAVADMAKVPNEVTEALRDGRPLPDPRLEALASFAIAMVETRGLPTRAQTEEFLAGGFSENHILQVLLALAVKTISNYTNHLFHTPVDTAFAKRTWEG